MRVPLAATARMAAAVCAMCWLVDTVAQCLDVVHAVSVDSTWTARTMAI